MYRPRPARTHTIAVVIATIAALFARAWLQVQLVDTGFDRGLAEDLSYLVVPPLILLLLGPVFVADRRFVLTQFSCDGLSWTLIAKAVSVGVLFRIVWHSQIVAGTAIGIYSTVPGPPAAFIYDCPAPVLLGLSVLVSSLLIPFIEELVHRGYVQSYFSNHGSIVAVILSSLFFVIFHPYEAWEFVLPGGLLLGTIYWVTGSLWASVIVHATVNLVPQLTLRCMSIPWPPAEITSPIWSIALAATILVLISSASLLLLTASLGKHRDTRSRHDIA